MCLSPHDQWKVGMEESLVSFDSQLIVIIIKGLNQLAQMKVICRQLQTQLITLISTSDLESIHCSPPSDI